MEMAESTGAAVPALPSLPQPMADEAASLPPSLEDSLTERPQVQKQEMVEDLKAPTVAASPPSPLPPLLLPLASVPLLESLSGEVAMEAEPPTSSSPPLRVLPSSESLTTSSTPRLSPSLPTLVLDPSSSSSPAVPSRAVSTVSDSEDSVVEVPQSSRGEKRKFPPPHELILISSDSDDSGDEEGEEGDEEGDGLPLLEALVRHSRQGGSGRGRRSFTPSYPTRPATSADAAFSGYLERLAVKREAKRERRLAKKVAKRARGDSQTYRPTTRRQQQRSRSEERVVRGEKASGNAVVPVLPSLRKQPREKTPRAAAVHRGLQVQCVDGTPFPISLLDPTLEGVGHVVMLDLDNVSADAPTDGGTTALPATPAIEHSPHPTFITLTLSMSHDFPPRVSCVSLSSSSVVELSATVNSFRRPVVSPRSLVISLFPCCSAVLFRCGAVVFC